MTSSAKAVKPLGRAQRRDGARVCALAVLAIVTWLNAVRLHAQPAGTMSQDKAVRVLWLARQAAKNQLQELSLRAVREALGNGSPVPSLTNANGESLSRDEAEQQMINAMESELRILTELWQQQRFDPNAIWETLRTVVIPDRRPGEIFTFQRLATADSLTMDLTDRSVGSIWIRQSIALERAEDCRRFLQSRIGEPQAHLNAWLMLLQLALEEKNIAEARACLSQFPEKLLGAGAPGHQLPVTITLLRAWSVSQLRDVLVPVMQQCVVKAMESAPEPKVDQAALTMSLILARESLRTGQSDAGLKLLTYADVLATRQTGSSALPLVDHHLLVAALLLQFGFEAPAMTRLTDAASMSIEPGSRSIQAMSKAAVLTRSFRNLSAKDRYEFLRQCLLVNNRSALMNPAVDFPREERPPDLFLSLLPESLRATGFWHTVSDAETVVSSVCELIDAAREAGESDALRTELVKLQKENHRTSSHLLTLFFIRNQMIEEAAAALRGILEELRQDAGQKGSGRVVSFDLLVALKAAELPRTRQMAIEMLDALRRYEFPTEPRDLAAHVSTGRARALALNSNIDSQRLFEAASPSSWVAAENMTQAGLARRSPRSLWLAHEGVITHQAGTENDALYFPWPLGGTFEFTVSSLDDFQKNGDLGFDGLACEVRSDTGSVLVSGLGSDNLRKRSLRYSQPGTWVRKSVRVTPTQLSFLVNGHPVFTEERTVHSSPWLALVARGTRLGLWRFPQFIGSPEILQNVSLANDPLMRGWSCSFFGQTRSSAGAVGRGASERTTGDSDLRKSFDWSWDAGVITGRSVRDARPLDGMLDESLQGLLRYDRPLVTGETLSWDFDYSPGRMEVHPALGRIAFLFRPDGVQLHWLSAGTDECTLLPADNAVAVQKDQRGPAQFPLQLGWNQAAMSLNADKVSLSINGVVVYEHELRPEDSRQFGLFHFRHQTTARARNILLVGDWPKTLTVDDLTALTGSRAMSLTSGEHHVLDSILGEEPFSTDVIDVVRFAAQLAQERRFDFLLDWVLPGDQHPDWRVYGDLVPSDDSLSTVSGADSGPMSLLHTNPNAARQSTGGFVASPAIQLVQTAREIGRLGELQSRIETLPNSEASDPRAKLAMQILLAFEDGRSTDAIPLIQQMSRVTQSLIHFTDSQIWPEMIVAQQTLKDSSLRPHAMDMLRHMASLPRASSYPINSALEKNLFSMIAMGELLQREKSDDFVVSELSAWQPFRITRADLRNDGLPLPCWVQHKDGSIQHVSGFEDDTLCWPVPLSGDFEFECELLPVGGEHLLVGYGGFFIKPAAEKNAFRRIPFGRDETVHTMADLIDDQNAVWSYRLVVSQGAATVFVNGKQLTTDAIPVGAPPWLCIRAAAKPGAVIRSIRLIGNPTVPNSFELDTGRDLDGWCRPYFGGGDAFVPRSMTTADWRSEESVIVGAHRSTLAGIRSESLLPYFRPVMEDGTITYYFFYDLGVTLVHPALDRLAFLLDKERGVLIHKITNGPFERSGLDPANAVAESQHQLVTTLPMREKDWNVMQLRLEGDMMTLVLNDTEIFRRPLERTNHRTFGLFHFQDESSARVRNLSWRGNWPRTLPE